VKTALKLRQRRGRERQDRFIFDGHRELARALEAGIEIVEIFLPAHRQLDEETAAVIELAKQRGVEVMSATKKIFERVAFGDRDDGLVAIGKTPRSDWREFEPPKDAFILVVERVEKPGNIGAMLRTANAVGAHAMFVADCQGDIYNHNLIRASLGAVFATPVFALSSFDAKEWLKQHKIRPMAALVDGSQDYAKVDYSGNIALVMGSEAEGLSEHWRDDSVTPISLPMHGQVDSLNVSNTAAVLMYEAQRQRRVS